MIGVIAESSDYEVVHEFFELFKTPWEYYRPSERYEAVVCTGEPESVPDAKVVLVYSGRELALDRSTDAYRVEPSSAGQTLSYEGIEYPLYGETASIAPAAEEDASKAGRVWLAHKEATDASVVVRVGFDLLTEVRALLDDGQPRENAALPTLDCHIAWMREQIVSNGGSLVEIPPAPAGYAFIACLTHDVDHPLVSRHRLDHTMAGFLYRAAVMSLARFLRGRLSLSAMWRNWAAVLKLPFVHLGWAADFWRDFDRYQTLDEDAPSTFFVIPFRGEAGQADGRSAPTKRAAAYGARDVAEQLRKITDAGGEIGLHGIDAWRDAGRASAELEEVQQAAKAPVTGARMHWLYFDRESPARLERAGVDYDSTVGYNETVGYRAGTAQAYKPTTAKRLLELPLHVMDTALFYPNHLNLSPQQARERMQAINNNAEKFGGCVTVNWHDRSIAPERLWGDSYSELVDDFRQRGAWLATASEAVAWFRMRRQARFGPGALGPVVQSEHEPALPGLQVRRHGALERRSFGELAAAPTL